LDAGKSVEYALAGVFVAFAAVVVFLVHGQAGAVLHEREELAGIAAAVAVAAIIWFGYLSTMLYELVWYGTGGYISRRRPCVADIVTRWNDTHKNDETFDGVPQRRVEILAYYAWAYAQEKRDTPLSSTLISRIAENWRRVHFAGANLVGIALGAAILVGATASRGAEEWQRLRWLLLAYLILMIILFIRRRQLQFRVHSLERFIVAENWNYLDDFMRKAITVPVETF